MKQKVALVTGAAAGIGAGTARRLAQDGVAVGVLDLDEERCAETVGLIEAGGGKAVALGADISNREQVTAAVAKLRSAVGPIVILVNNAAVSGYAPFLEMTDEQWDTVIRINLTGAFIVSQITIPDMVKAEWGRVVNISSMGAQGGAPNIAHYAASKGGIIALTRSMTHEFGPHGITVNTIAPRFIAGTIMASASVSDGHQRAVEAEIAAGPIRRAGRPEDVAGMVAYLASEEAGFVTGQTLSVNGGRYIS